MKSIRFVLSFPSVSRKLFYSQFSENKFRQTGLIKVRVPNPEGSLRFKVMKNNVSENDVPAIVW